MTLAINDKPVLNLKAVVFATDFSLCSQNAGLYAARTAAYFSAKLLVTHAFTRSQAAMEVTRYREAAQQVNFYTALLTRVRALPGVEAAGFARAVPGQGYWAITASPSLSIRPCRRARRNSPSSAGPIRATSRPWAFLYCAGAALTKARGSTMPVKRW